MIIVTKNDTKLPSPWPYFGGKGRVASVVWQLLGDPQHFIEPFGGSLAVLLRRPSSHNGDQETVNDKDAYIQNMWRALQKAPEEVASWADWPIMELDLTARHRWLIEAKRKADLPKLLANDPFYYNAQIAGWYIWGASSWFGSGFCTGEWFGPDDERNRGGGQQLPHWGRGVHRKSTSDIGAYFALLSERLRTVRICCGDWKRVVTKPTLLAHRRIGVFLDPPYSLTNPEVTHTVVYRHDNFDTKEVEAWCKATAAEYPHIRIVLAGREGEYDLPGWSKLAWAAKRPFATADSVDDGDRFKERLWASPACLSAKSQVSLLDSLGEEDAT